MLVGLPDLLPLDRRSSLAIPASAFLTVLAAICLVAGSYGSSLHLSEYGLVGSFRPTFFVGLTLLTLASSLLWFTRQRADAMSLMQIVLLVAILWLLPYLLETTPRFRTSYKNFGAVDWLLEGHGFAPSEVFYHNWPLFPLVMVGFIQLTGIDPLDLMGLFPFVIQLAYLPPLLVFLRTLIPDSGNRVWAGIWFFYLLNWTGQDYFSPQAFVFLIVLILLAVLAHTATRRRGEFGAPLMSLTLALYGAIVLTHTLTALLMLGLVAALVLFRMVRPWPIVVTIAMMFLAWQLYGAFPYFEVEDQDVLDSVYDPMEFVGLNVSKRLEGAPGHQAIAQLRMLSTVIAFLLVFACFALRALYKPDVSDEVVSSKGWLTTIKSRLWLSVPSVKFGLLLQAAIFAVAPIYVYGGEILIRVLLFSLPLLAVLLVGTLSVRGPVVLTAVVLAAMAPLHPLTHYGNEAYDYVSPAELEGFQYIARELAPANIYGGYPGGAFRNTKELEWRHAVTAGKAKLPEVNNYSQPSEYTWRYRDRPIYIVLGRGDGAGAYLFYNQEGLLEQAKAAFAESCHYQAVFENEDYAIYRWWQECLDQQAAVASAEVFATS